MKLEKCAGCGHLAKVADDGTGGHPMIGVMNAADAKALGFEDQTPTVRGFVNVPVCGPCHADPEHRVYTLKCTYFRKQDALAATTLAGINEVLMPPIAV